MKYFVILDNDKDAHNITNEGGGRWIEKEMLNSQTLGQDWGQTYKWAFVLRIKYYIYLIRRVLPGFSQLYKSEKLMGPASHHVSLVEKVCRSMTFIPFKSRESYMWFKNQVVWKCIKSKVYSKTRNS